MVGWLTGAALSASLQHLERLRCFVLLVQEKIKVQTLKYGFDRMNIALHHCKVEESGVEPLSEGDHLYLECGPYFPEWLLSVSATL